MKIKRILIDSEIKSTSLHHKEMLKKTALTKSDKCIKTAGKSSSFQVQMCDSLYFRLLQTSRKSKRHKKKCKTFFPSSSSGKTLINNKWGTCNSSMT